MTKNVVCDVIVVGGGFAGLACADQLHRDGRYVVVLEARNRVGGRVHSRSDLIDSKVVEAGGELLGSNHPTVLHFADRFGLRLIDADQVDAELRAPIVLNGHRLKPDECELVDAETEQTFAKLTDLAKDVNLAQPWLTPQASDLDRTSLAEWLRPLSISQLSKWMVEGYFTSNNSVPSDCQSLLGNLAQIAGGGLERYWTDSERYRCAEGNQQFAIRLAVELGHERILLNTVVSEIILTDDHATVISQNGASYKAMHLVLAIPPSLWNRVRITPQLPPSLFPQMGKAIKFLSVVRNRFWESRHADPGAFVFANRPELYKHAGNVWWGTENQCGVSGDEGLVSFISGPAAVAWADSDDAARIREYQRAVESAQPGFQNAVTQTEWVNWVGDEYSRASYSFPAPGQVTTQGPVFRFGLGRLQFAGEHTCYPFIGYMEGALQSGIDAANRISIAGF